MNMTITDQRRNCRSFWGIKGFRTGFAPLAAGLLLITSLHVRAQGYAMTNLWASVATTTSIRQLGYSSISNQVFLPNTGGSIAVYDGTAGTSVGSVSFSGVTTSGTQTANQIGVADDGVIYVANLVSAVSGSSVYRLYRWSSWNAAGLNAYTGDPTASTPTVDGKRLGDSLAVTGSGVNTKIIVGIASTTPASFVLFSTADGTNFVPTVITNTTGLASFSTGGLGLSFYTNNTFIVKQPGGTTISLVQFPANYSSFNAVTGTVLATTSLPTPSGPASSGTAMLTYNANASLLGVSFLGSSGSSQNYYGRLYNLNFTSGATLLASTNYTAASNGNLTGGVALGGAGNTNVLYVMNSANNVQALSIIVTPPQPPTISVPPTGISGFPSYTLSVTALGTAPLAYQWSASNNNTNISSTFTNIPNATNTSYTVSAISTNYYQVLITNVAGSVTSTPVRVALATPVTSVVVTQLWTVAAGSYAYLSASDNSARGLGYDTNSQRLVVASVTGGSGLYIVDANTGTNMGTLSLSGVTFGGLISGVDQVGIADDGAVYAGNLVSGTGFTLWRWPAPTNGATATQAFVDAGQLGGGDRWGDTMAVQGSGVNTEIILGSRGGTNIALLTTSDGLNFSGTFIIITNVPGGFAANGITFGAGNTIWAKSYLGHLYQIAYDPVGLVGGVLLDYPNPGKIPTTQVGVAVDSVRNIMAGIDVADSPNDVKLYQLTGTSDAPVLFDQAFFASANGNGNENVAIVMKYPRVYALDVNNGLIGLTYGVPPSTAPTANVTPASQTTYTNNPALTFGATATGSLPIYYQWQFGLTTNNASFGNVANATNSSYTLNYPSPSKAGYYRVVARNVAGFATSTPPALLTVLLPTTSLVVTQLWTQPAGSLGFLDGSSYNTRGLAYDTNTAQVIVADAGNIHLLSATNGSYLGDLNVLGVYNGGYNYSGNAGGSLFDQVGVADDGTLYAANLALTGPNFSILTWAAGTLAVGNGATGYAYGGGTGGDPGNGSGDRWGDTMDVRGSGTSTEILIGSYTGTNVVLFTTTDGTTFTANLIAVTNVPAGFSGQGIAFGDGDSFYTKSPGYLLRKVTFNRTTWTGGAALVYSAMPSAFDGIDVDVAANILGGVNFSDTPNDLQLYLLSGNINTPGLVDQAFFGSVNINSQFNAATTLKGGLGFALDVNNGVTAVSYGAPGAPAVLLTSVAYAPGAVGLSWNNTFNNHSYQVQYKDHLLDAIWNNLGSPVTATGPTASYTDTTAAGTTRFYRVLSQ